MSDDLLRPDVPPEDEERVVPVDDDEHGPDDEGDITIPSTSG